MSTDQELKAIREVAIRGSQIVRQLMIYAGKESEVPGLVNVSRVVEEMLGLLRVSVSKHAALETDLGQDLPAVRGGAATSANCDEPGHQRFRGDRRFGWNDPRDHKCAWRSKESAAVSSTKLPDGDYVQLEVSDTGGGMSAETRTGLFDPFFTTKSGGAALDWRWSMGLSGVSVGPFTF